MPIKAYLFMPKFSLFFLQFLNYLGLFLLLSFLQVLFQQLIFFFQIILSLRVRYLCLLSLIFLMLPPLNLYHLYSLNLYLLLFLLENHGSIQIILSFRLQVELLRLFLFRRGFGTEASYSRSKIPKPLDKSGYRPKEKA